MSEEYALAFSEVLSLINSSSEEEKNKIPHGFINFLNSNRSQTYNPVFDENTAIKDLDLKKETKWLLSLIYVSYLANDEQKQEFANILKENSEKYEQEQKEKYDIYKVFEQEQKRKEEARIKAQEAAKIDTEPANMVKYKRESIITRIINKIKNLFRR